MSGFVLTSIHVQEQGRWASQVGTRSWPVLPESRPRWLPSGTVSPAPVYAMLLSEASHPRASV